MALEDGAIAGELASFLARHDDAGELVWFSALAFLERAVESAREAKWGRFRSYPKGELRRLRRDVAHGLELARLAVAYAEQEQARTHELDEELREIAAEAGRQRRRAQTSEAQRVRLLRAECRREGREPTDEELHPSS